MRGWLWLALEHLIGGLAWAIGERLRVWLWPDPPEADEDEPRETPDLSA